MNTNICFVPQNNTLDIFESSVNLLNVCCKNTKYSENLEKASKKIANIKKISRFIPIVTF